MRKATLTLVLVLGLILVSDATAASVEGIPLNWRSTGTGRQTIVFVHGWTCDTSSWEGQVPALAGRYRLVTLDLPGHGASGSPKDGRFSMDLFARAVEAVRSEAKADRIVLVGHSMGTPVIRRYARLYPQRVAGLVIVDGLVALPSSGPAGSNTPPPDPARMGGPQGLKNRESMVRGMFTPATPQGLQQRILKMMLGAPEATATGAMIATFDASNWKDDVLDVPVLGVYAEKSGLGMPDYSRKIFPTLEYVEIPGTGHFLMMEKPQEFNRLLSTFVDTRAAF